MNSLTNSSTDRDQQPEAVTKDRQQRELEAEAIAYVVMRHFGIGHVACNYLATYKIDGAQLKQSLQPSVQQRNSSSPLSISNSINPEDDTAYSSVKSQWS